MSTIASTPAVHYPESDGLPMSDNTVQFRWITTIEGGLEAVFANDPEVFVAGNLLWYPVEGDNTIRVAPDVMVVFGRPKGDRGSWLQWKEEGIGPQVVFESVSPGNRAGKLIDKFKFFELYGVEEYYLYDPDTGALDGWIGRGAGFVKIPAMNGWTSPRLKVRFDLIEGLLILVGPDGKKFATYVDLAEQREMAIREKEQALREKQAAQREKELAQQRAERLADQLKAAGIKPED